MKAALLHPQVARVWRDVSMTKLTEQVERGDWLWVFDLGDRGSRARVLRFWRQELDGPAGVRRLALSTVVERIIGCQRPRLRARELVELLSISPQHLLRLAQTGELAYEVQGHTAYVARASLAAWLRRRWVGSMEQR